MKKILTGTSALVAAVGFAAAAHAADAPPPTPVLGCSAFGAGYFTVPGGDGTCIRVYGFVRNDFEYLPTVTRSQNAYIDNVTGSFRIASKTNTDIGLVNTYIDYRINGKTAAASSTSNSYSGTAFTAKVYQAYLQAAGFTVGRHITFFGLYSDMLHNGSAYGAKDWLYTAGGGNGDHTYEMLGVSNGMADHKANLIAYTYSPVKGWFGSVSLEDPTDMRGGVFSASSTTHLIESTTYATSATTNVYGGVDAPDVLLNVRNDASWGSAMLVGALHEVNVTETTVAGKHNSPSEQMGYAFEGQSVIALPGLGNGNLDVLGLGAGYEKGALRYVFSGLAAYDTLQSDSIAATNLAASAKTGQIPLADGYIDTANGNKLTLPQGWALNGALVHFWLPNVSSQAVVSYGQIHNDSGLADQKVLTGTLGLSWRPINNLEVTAEGNVVRLDTDSVGSGATHLASSGATNWIGWLRVEKDF